MPIGDASFRGRHVACCARVPARSSLDSLPWVPSPQTPVGLFSPISESQGTGLGVEPKDTGWLDFVSWHPVASWGVTPHRVVLYPPLSWTILSSCTCLPQYPCLLCPARHCLPPACPRVPLPGTACPLPPGSLCQVLPAPCPLCPARRCLPPRPGPSTRCCLPPAPCS